MNLRAVAITLAATLAVGACSAPPLDARLDISAAMEDGTIVVSGSTNLPDGARIFVYVWHEAETLPCDSENLVTVVDGRYEARVDPMGWPPGVAHVSAGFLLDGQGPQPSHVLAVVGEFGERLDGAQAHEGEYGYRYVQSDRVDVRLQ